MTLYNPRSNTNGQVQVIILDVLNVIIAILLSLNRGTPLIDLVYLPDLDLSSQLVYNLQYLDGP